MVKFTLLIQWRSGVCQSRSDVEIARFKLETLCRVECDVAQY